MVTGSEAKRNGAFIIRHRKLRQLRTRMRLALAKQREKQRRGLSKHADSPRRTCSRRNKPITHINNNNN